MTYPRVDNLTRYDTGDLQALVKFCVDHAPLRGSVVVPRQFRFLEYSPRAPVHLRFCRFADGVQDYIFDYENFKVRPVRTEPSSPGIVWLAAPETFVDNLAMLCAVDNAPVPVSPRMVAAVADAIKGFWHYTNVQKDLNLDLRVHLAAKRPATALSREIIRKNRYVDECEQFANTVGTAKKAFNDLQVRRGKLRERAAAIGLPDPFLQFDFESERAASMEFLNAGVKSIEDSLASMREKESKA
jgi:hypothetical protein